MRIWLQFVHANHPREWSWLTLGALPRRVSAARRSRYHHPWFDSTRPPFKKRPWHAKFIFFFHFCVRTNFIWFLIILSSMLMTAKYLLIPFECRFICRCSCCEIWVQGCLPPNPRSSAWELRRRASQSELRSWISLTISFSFHFRVLSQDDWGQILGKFAYLKDVYLYVFVWRKDDENEG